MNFEQVRVIWYSQDKRPLYAVDEVALHASIRRGSSKFRNLIMFCHVAIAAT